MRAIVKRAQPLALTRWRQERLAKNKKPGMECTYDELRRDSKAIAAVENALYLEQGGICAYTGHKLHLALETAEGERKVGFHVEHLISQERCRKLDGAVYGEDTDYCNLVACYPPKNCGYTLEYGAHRKGSGPSSAEDRDFVSPLRPDCSRRFKFDRNGRIAATNPQDRSALRTIEMLRLDHDTLSKLRKSAIVNTLDDLKLKDAKRLLADMRSDAARLDRGHDVCLDPFCFAIEQALERYIKKLEGIRASAKEKAK